MREADEKVLLLEHALLGLDDVVEGRVVVFEVGVGLNVVAEQDGHAQHARDCSGTKRVRTIRVILLANLLNLLSQMKQLT